MAKIYMAQRQEKYSDGQTYWDTLHQYRNQEKALAKAKTISGRVRVVEDEEE